MKNDPPIKDTSIKTLFFPRIKNPSKFWTLSIFPQGVFFTVNYYWTHHTNNLYPPSPLSSYSPITVFQLPHTPTGYPTPRRILLHLPFLRPRTAEAHTPKSSSAPPPIIHHLPNTFTYTPHISTPPAYLLRIPQHLLCHWGKASVWYVSLQSLALIIGRGEHR